MDSCLTLSHEQSKVECEGRQYSEQEHAPVVQPLRRDGIQLEHVLKGNFFLSKQNRVTSLRPLLITGLGQRKVDYKREAFGHFGDV